VESGTKPAVGQRVEQFRVNQSVPYCRTRSTMKPSVSARMLVT
jgi:hypothetical protein